MKKILILAGVIGLMTTTQVFAQDEVKPFVKSQCPCPMVKCGTPDVNRGGHKIDKKHPDFKKLENDLKLTDEQKVKAQALREQEREQIKPILDKIDEKLVQEQEIMNKKLTAVERQEELAPIREEIHALRKEIHKIKKQSKEDFKALLSDKQVKKLEKLKAKKDFKKAHKPRADWEKRRPPMMPECGSCTKKTPVPPIVE